MEAGVGVMRANIWIYYNSNLSVRKSTRGVPCGRKKSQVLGVKKCFHMLDEKYPKCTWIFGLVNLKQSPDLKVKGSVTSFH